jgi:large subunit ribosomal protein L30
MAYITVTLKKSLISAKKAHILTARSLRLKKIGDSSVQPNNDATKGKIRLISHLIKVTATADPTVKTTEKPAKKPVIEKTVSKDEAKAKPAAKPVSEKPAKRPAVKKAAEGEAADVPKKRAPRKPAAPQAKPEA